MATCSARDQLIYVDYLPAAHAWKATYLPVYAAMRALFQSVYLQAFLNPFLAALTVRALRDRPQYLA